MDKSAIVFRPARPDDLVSIVRLLADDPLGSRRERIEDPLPASYHAAFEAIERDPNSTLIIAEHAGRLAGVLQLTYIPNLTYQGGLRAQIEGVRVTADLRQLGIGRALVEHAIEMARAAGCRLIQLTTDKSRPDAVRFYESLSFRPTHEGMKRFLDGDSTG